MDHLLGFGFDMPHVATSATDIRTIILVHRFRNSRSRLPGARSTGLKNAEAPPPHCRTELLMSIARKVER
jgi:hypothetical protein